MGGVAGVSCPPPTVPHLLLLLSSASSPCRLFWEITFQLGALRDQFFREAGAGAGAGWVSPVMHSGKPTAVPAPWEEARASRGGGVVVGGSP